MRDLSRVRQENRLLVRRPCRQHQLIAVLRVSRGVRLSFQAPKQQRPVPLHFLRPQNLHDTPPLVYFFHHPRAFTTLVGSPQSRNLFHISALATSRKVPYGITAP